MSDKQITGPHWDLSAEYDGPEDSRIRDDLDELQSLYDRAQALTPELSGPTAVDAAQQIAKWHALATVLLSNVSVFANCLLSVDATDAEAQKLNGALQRYRKQMGDVFEPWSQFVDAASSEQLEQYLSDPEIAPSAFLVEHARSRSHEKLSLSEESLVNGLSQDGIHAWGRLYDQIAGALECEVLVGNETQTLGLAQTTGLLSSPQDGERRAAWQAINQAWTKQEESCAASINAIAGWRLEMCKQRSHHQPVHFLDAPVHMNRIDRAVLDTLMTVAADNKGLVQRAALLQGRAYGKSGFGPWDLRAPAPVLKDNSSSGIPFAEAIDIITQAYGAVHPDLAEFVSMMVSEHWIEGSVSRHKAPGAHCTGFAKSRTPRVYMTYTGGASDVITLAHELGHALHSWVMRDLPETQRSYGMSLAETASTFGETLVRDALLARSNSASERLNILWEEMSALTSFMLNIPTRFEFERRFYEARQARPLHVAEIKQMMAEAWRCWYGDALEEPDEMFWASKLHFYISGLSFYNFPYLFGYLFSLGIYSRREDMGEQFYARYVDLLRDTGRMGANSLAQKHLAVRLDQPDFWQQTINTLSPRVDAFEQVLEEVGL